jgi:hypothetical protein
MILTAEYKNANFYEISLATNFALGGNIYVSNEPWILRDSDINSWGRREQSINKIGTFVKYKSDYKSYINIFSREKSVVVIIIGLMTYIICRNFRLLRLKLAEKFNKSKS